MTLAKEPQSIAADLELLKSDALGRVKVPAKKREAILDAFEQSGMSGLAFASHIGVKYPTFATWVQKRRREGNALALAKADREPLALVEAVLDRGESVSGGLEVEALDGVKLRLACREDIALAVEFLRALKD